MSHCKRRGKNVKLICKESYLLLHTCDVEEDGEAGRLGVVKVLEAGARLLGRQIQRELQHEHPGDNKYVSTIIDIQVSNYQHP